MSCGFCCIICMTMASHWPLPLLEDVLEKVDWRDIIICSAGTVPSCLNDAARDCTGVGLPWKLAASGY